ncbi:MAG: hypothetical protein ACJ76Z_16380 [Thermoleophilaceae bacterium]
MDDHQISLPSDPTGIAEPHDILAAEDYAMPAGPDRLAAQLRSGGARSPLAIFAAAAAFGVVLAALRRRR